MTVEPQTIGQPQTSDSISSITRSAFRFFSGTALSRLSGMLRDMVLAFCFGTHEAVAALFVAFRLTSVCRRLFGEGALQSAFIPVFEELRKEGPTRAFRFFRDLFCLLALFLVGFCLVSMLGLASSYSFIDWSPGNDLIVFLMIIMMPSLFFICLFGLNSSLLQCEKRFFTVGIAPACFNVAIVLGSLFFASWEPSRAMPYISIFLVVGCMLQCLVTFGPAFRSLKEALGTTLVENIQLCSSDIRRFGGPLVLGLLGVGATQINNAVDSFFARSADPEGPALLWYSIRLLQLPLALFGIALSGALLPPLSRSIQAGRREEYLRFLDFALRRVFALLVPCSLALFVFGTGLINAIYRRGDFQLHSLIATCNCLHAYALGLLPMGMIIVLAPAFYAFKDYKTPARAAYYALGINLALNCLFIYGFNWHAMSVALATSISSWINVIYLYKRLKGHFGALITKDGLFEMGKVIIISCIVSVVAYLFQSYYFVTPMLFSLFQEVQVHLPSTLFDQLLYVGAPCLLALVVMVGLAWIFKAQDLLVLMRIRRPA